jgi:FMN reductase
MGWQGTVTALQALRTTVHALRGWPTPLGITLNSAQPVFNADGGLQDPETEERFAALADQVVSFARRWSVDR